MNHAGSLMSNSSEIFIGSSDDFDCFPSWDKELISVFKDFDNFNVPKAAKIFDGFWHVSVPRITLIVANKAFYNRIGYIVYPEYVSLFGDDDFYQVCTKLNCIIDATHLRFQHNHHTIGLNSDDNTYKKINSKDSYEFGERIFKKRSERNFDL